MPIYELPDGNTVPFSGKFRIITVADGPPIVDLQAGLTAGALAGVSDTADLALISELAAGSYVVPLLAIDPGISNQIIYANFGGVLDGVPLGAANTVLKSTGLSGVPQFAQIADADIASGAAIGWTKVSKTGSSLLDLATRSASDLNSGTLPDGRFPATLPAASGVNLTALNASNLASGNIAYARLPSAGGTWNAGGGAVEVTGSLRTSSNLTGTGATASSNAITAQIAGVNGWKALASGTQIWYASDGTTIDAQLTHTQGSSTLALTGALTISSTLAATTPTFTLNQNAGTRAAIINTTDGTASLAEWAAQSDNNAAGSSRRFRVMAVAESHGTSSWAGRAVFTTDNIPGLLFNPITGTTTGLDEVISFEAGSALTKLLTLLKKQTTGRKIASFFTNAPTDTGGDGVVFVADRTAAPSSDPSGGFVFSSNSGVPTFRTSAAAGGKVINLDQAAAYNQTFATASRTVNAYTSNAQSGAYTGIDNAQLGSVYAQLTDLNSLRVAYETLRASYDNVMQVVNALIDDSQARGLAA